MHAPLGKVKATQCTAAFLTRFALVKGMFTIRKPTNISFAQDQSMASDKHAFYFLSSSTQNVKLLILARSVAQYTTLKEIAITGLNHHNCYQLVWADPFCFAFTSVRIVHTVVIQL